MIGKLLSRVILLLSVVMLGMPLLLGQPEGGETRAQMRDRMREVRQKLTEIFKKDPEARIPLDELNLPARMSRRLDRDRDGFITRSEAERLLRRRGGRGNRRNMSMLRDGGFPLNVDPESVPAEDAPIGDDDMVMGTLINGQARAYPVNYMMGPTNEVVNDVLGGEAIAPSW